MKKTTLLSLALVTSISATSLVNAYEAILLDNDPAASYDYEATLPKATESRFATMVGTVTSVQETNGVITAILIDREEAGSANILVNPETVVIGTDLAEGDMITVHHVPLIFAPAIYPPQYTAAVVFQHTDEPTFVSVNGFVTNPESEGELMAVDHSLRVLVGEDTLITDHEGNAFDFDIYLNGRNLVVIYSISTRSLPPLTTPEQIMVLPVTGMMPEMPVLEGEYAGDGGYNDTFWDLDLGALEIDQTIDWSNYPIIVEGSGLAVDFVHLNETVYLPIRAVVEALGFTLEWNRELASMQLITPDHIITLAVDSADFVRDGQTITLAHPTLLIDGVSHVPINFFREVVGFNNAFFAGGHVTINNDEVME